MKENITTKISLLLSKGLPFAAFRMPDEEVVKSIVQISPEVLLLPFDRLDNFSGFVIAPFLSYQTKKFFGLQSDFSFSGTNNSKIMSILSSLPETSLQYPAQNRETSRSEYLEQAKSLIATMKQNEIRKVVLSRYFSQQVEKNFSSSSFFGQLCMAYPRAFVYLFYLPSHGLWTGATPETLIEKKGADYQTMALAGTQKFVKNVRWENKEVQEQQYVVDFIEMQLKSLGIADYKMGSKETVQAGKLAHLQTRFQIRADAVEGEVANLVERLHPTPAVGGFPKKEACKLIASTEKYDRRFYTGFLGPWNLEEKQHLFVNLRCAERLENHLGLYVGGGLTADSNPELEWQETVNKSQTILAVAKKLRTFAP